MNRNDKFKLSDKKAKDSLRVRQAVLCSLIAIIYIITSNLAVMNFIIHFTGFNMINAIESIYEVNEAVQSVMDKPCR